MKIILLKHVPKLGNPGDTVEVAAGYGRNFLIAKGLAREATRDASEQAAAKRAKKKRKIEEVEKERNKLSGALGGQVILVRAKANEEGHLFGGVGAEEICEAIAKRKKINLHEKAIKLPHKLKALGKHEVVLDLGGGETVTITVDIERNE
ncbi:MAG: 50S ribosomal protein L9 [bacterium]|nr:50S ribosomal protein L9 [bacterium]